MTSSPIHVHEVVWNRFDIVECLDFVLADAIVECGRTCRDEVQPPVCEADVRRDKVPRFTERCLFL
jgi:hypothetical protein